MADFGILQTPNFAGAVLAGYNAGQSLGKQQRLDTALGGVDLERPETIIPILQADPTTGAALLGTSVRFAEMKHEQTKAHAIGSALSDYFSAQGGSPSATAKPAGTITANVPAAADTEAPAEADQPGEVTVTAQTKQAPDMGRTIAALVDNGASVEDAQHFVNLVGTMNDQHKAALADAQDAIGHAALQLRAVPQDQRRATLDQMAPQLLQHHVTMDQINGADLSDGGLEGIFNQSMTVKDIIAGQRDDAKFEHQKQQDTIQNGFRAQEIGISRGNLGVSQRRLADEEKGLIGANGKPTSGADPMTGLPQPLTKAAYDALPPNTRYRAPDGSIKIKGAH